MAVVIKLSLVTLMALFLVCPSTGTVLKRSARQVERETNGGSYNRESNDVNANRIPAPTPESDMTTVVEGGEETDVEDDGNIFGDGLFLSLEPFHNLGEMFSGFKRMENILRTTQERLHNMTQNLPTNYDNSTEENIQIDGHSFKLQRTTIRRGDNDSSVFISVTKLVSADSRRKREVNLPFSRLVRQAQSTNATKPNSDTSESSEETTARPGV